MKKLLIFFVLLSTFVYGDVLEDVRKIVAEDQFLYKLEKPIDYDESVLKKLDFSDERLRNTMTDGLTLEEHIKDIGNPLYSRWAYKVADAVIILSVASGPRRETDNYVFRKEEDGIYRYRGNYFYGDYTTGLTFIETSGDVYILNYYIDESNKELVKCDVYDRNLDKLGEVTKSGVSYEIVEEAAILSQSELMDMLENQEQERFVLGDEKYEGSPLGSKLFVLDYNNDSKLDEIYLEYYRSETYNTLDELRVEFSNEVLDSYFKDALGRVMGMKVFMVKDSVYMAFLEKDAFYTDRHYGNYIRIFQAKGTEVTEVARFEYREETEFEIERM